MNERPKHPAQLIDRYQPFPAEVLPPRVAGFIRAAAESMRCALAFVAVPLLVGFASAIGNSRRIQLKRGWTEPSILWGAIVGESGTMKSPALELPLRAIRQRQDLQMREYSKAIEQWERDIAAYDAQKTRRGHSAPGEKPKRPICQRCWADDVTPEALAKLLQENPRGMLAIRDELAGWLHFDRYSGGKGAKGSEATKWAEMFGGRSLIVDRRTSGVVHVPQASVSLVGGIQPGILSRYISQEHRDNGLLARLLLTMPDQRRKVWTESDIDPRAEAGIAEIFEALYALAPARGPDDEPQPAIVSLTPNGLRAWEKFYNQHNEELADLTGDLASCWSKLEGYTARFALVLHEVRRALGEDVGNAVDARSVVAGVALVRWFGHEARRVYATMDESDEDRHLRTLVDWIERKGGTVTVRDVTHGNRWYRGQAELARADLRALAAAGYGQLAYPPTGPKGGQPSEQFQIDRGYSVTSTPPETGTPVTSTPAETPENGGSGTGDTGDSSQNTHAPDTPDVGELPGCPDGEGPSADAHGSDDDWQEIDP